MTMNPAYMNPPPGGGYGQPGMPPPPGGYNPAAGPPGQRPPGPPMPGQQPMFNGTGMPRPPPPQGEILTGLFKSRVACTICWINSLWPGDAVRHHKSRSPLVQVMAWHLPGAKLYPEPMVTQIHADYIIFSKWPVRSPEIWWLCCSDECEFHFLRLSYRNSLLFNKPKFVCPKWKRVEKDNIIFFVIIYYKF